MAQSQAGDNTCPQDARVVCDIIVATGGRCTSAPTTPPLGPQHANMSQSPAVHLALCEARKAEGGDTLSLPPPCGASAKAHKPRDGGTAEDWRVGRRPPQGDDTILRVGLTPRLSCWGL